MFHIHKKKDISKYLRSCDKVFKKIFQYIKNKKRMKKSDLKFSGFTRLTRDK